MIVIMFGMFLFLDMYNIDLEKANDKRLVKQVVIET